MAGITTSVRIVDVIIPPTMGAAILTSISFVFYLTLKISYQITNIFL